MQDIHDGVGSRINLLLWGLRTHPPEPNAMESELQRCIDELRFAINPQKAGHETLHQALQGLVDRLQSRAGAQGIQLDYERLGPAMPVPSELGLHLYKVAQECLSNALRHSQANKVTVRLTQTDDSLELRVQDNGKGIAGWDSHVQQQAAASATAMGLRSLHSRTQSRGGDLVILSGPEGTCIDVRFRRSSS